MKEKELRITHASVFSGIGGPEVAAAMLGWENLFHCEINPFGRAVLDYWFPKSKSYEDITKTDFSEWRGRVTVLTGGFPYQPFSYAGQRRGADDDRYLWPFMHRCINQVKPDWVVCENVGGILTMVEQGSVSEVANAPTLFGEEDSVHRYRYEATFTLERICADLEADGYEVQPILIPAASVGAPHQRDRVFFVAHTAMCGDSGRPGSVLQEIGRPTTQQPESIINGSFRSATDTDSDRGCEVDKPLESEQPNGAVAFGNGWKWNAPCPRWDYDTAGGWLPTQSPVHRGSDGISIRLDNLSIPFAKWRNESVKAYGNAIVPQVMYEIFRTIEQVIIKGEPQ